MTIGLFYGVMMMCQYQQLPGNKQKLGGIGPMTPCWTKNDWLTLNQIRHNVIISELQSCYVAVFCGSIYII